jgi:CubicO group peptidase (beta-lactamase class C family)
MMGDPASGPLMKRAFLVLVLGMSTALAAPARAQSPLFKLVREYIESLRIQAGIPGLAVAVVGRDNIIWDQAFGRQDLEKAIDTRTDTPFHLDALTQIFSSSLALRCVEEGRLSLDDRIGQFKSGSSEPNATIRQLLTHTTGASSNPIFDYRPERLEPLTAAVRACEGSSYRESLMNLFVRLAMRDSVPGPDAIHLEPPAEGIPDPAARERFTHVLQRLATPYSVDKQKRASPSKYPATTLTPASGLISTVWDIAQFDLDLKDGFLLPETLALAWTAPSGVNGQPLPHGLGWFVQTYNGEKIVWQFGVGQNASSALVVMLPARGMTYILLANSTGLVEPLPMAAAQLMASPFVRVLLGFFTGPG